MVSTHEGEASAYLIDQWGRTYPVSNEMSLGRRAGGHGLAIAFATVSSRHATIGGRRDGWYIRDLGSTNGTSVNGTAVDGRRQLANGDRVSVGDVVFLFAVDDLDNPNKEFNLYLIEDGDPKKPTQPKKKEVQPRTIELFSFDRNEAGGLLKLGMSTATLPALQFEFVERLARQLERRSGTPSVDGYVSVEEFASMNWNSAVFSASTLRRLVYSVRKTLKAASIPEIVETGERDRGYRLAPDYTVKLEDDAEEPTVFVQQPRARNTFDVVIEAVGERKLDVIKQVRTLTNLGVKAAKMLVESAPVAIFQNVEKAEAAMIKTALEAAGAVVALK